MPALNERMKTLNLSKGKPECATPGCEEEGWIWFGGDFRCGKCIAKYEEIKKKATDDILKEE